MAEQQKVDLFSLFPEDIAHFCTTLGEPAYRAKQVYEFFCKGVKIEAMTSLSKKLRERLLTCVEERLPDIAEKQESRLDGTVKYLLRLFDDTYIECVLMKYKHGNTLCISSQVGCRMGCVFCASTIGGKVRDLTPSELLGQVIIVQKDSGERVDNIVMMGIGEPLDNYANVLKFLHLVNRKDGLCIGHRHISLSTCGLADKIIALAEENLQITLSVSLHAVRDDKRSAMMPVNRKFNLEALFSALCGYYLKTKRRISFEYTLLSGENDSVDDAKNLAEYLKKAFVGLDAPLHVNLIRVNTVAERQFSSGKPEQVNRFAQTLEKAGIRATVRRRLGSDIDAACGQLRRKKELETKTSEAKTSETKTS